MNDVLNQMQVSIFVTDPDTDEILFMNEKMKKDYQISEPEGKNAGRFFRLGKKGAANFAGYRNFLRKQKKTM